MKKICLVLVFFFCLPGLIWAKESKIKPGVVLTKENYKNYLTDLKSLLPAPTFTAYTKGLEQGWITMPIKEKQNYPAPKGWKEANANSIGKCKTGPNNTLTGWVAGLPFYPNPQTGLELGWNAYRRCMHPDDLDMPITDFLLFNKNGKMERSFRWTLYKKRWVGRVDQEPLGEVPGNKGVLNSKESIVITKPLDVKGFCMVRIKYEDIEREDENFSFIPAIRRIRRLTGADVTDPLLGSDCIPDDFEVWRQKISPKMTFKILEEKDVLVPRFYGYDEGLQDISRDSYIKGSCFQMEWEIRPCWLLEITMTDPDYAYARRVIYVDKEDGACTLWYGDNYDRKGRLFRATLLTPNLFNFKNRLKGNCGFHYFNCLTEHSTLMDMRAFDLTGTKVSGEKFTIKALLKEAR